MTVNIGKIDHLIGATTSTKMDVFNKYYSAALTKFLQDNPQNPCADVLNDPQQHKYILGGIPSITGISSEFRTYLMAINPHDLDKNSQPKVSLFKFKTIDGDEGNSLGVDSLEPVDTQGFVNKLDKLGANLRKCGPNPGPMIKIQSEILSAGKTILSNMTAVQANHSPMNSPRSVADEVEEEKEEELSPYNPKLS